MASKSPENLSAYFQQQSTDLAGKAGRRAQSYAPVPARDDEAVLVAEWLAGLIVIWLGVFTSSSDYATVMLQIGKRYLAVTAIFFVLALLAAGGGKKAEAAKWMGLLIDVGIVLSATQSGLFQALSVFFNPATTATTAAESLPSSTGTDSGLA